MTIIHLVGVGAHVDIFKLAIALDLRLVAVVSLPAFVFVRLFLLLVTHVHIGVREQVLILLIEPREVLVDQLLRLI